MRELRAAIAGQRFAAFVAGFMKSAGKFHACV